MLTVLTQIFREGVGLQHDGLIHRRRYIGSHMVHALLEAGEQVAVLDNLTTGHFDRPKLGDPELMLPARPPETAIAKTSSGPMGYGSFGV